MKKEININAQIDCIFPTPIYRSNIERSFTKRELNYISYLKKDNLQNLGNITSKNNYVLRNTIFNNINFFLEISVKEYFKKIINPLRDITPYITQSWVNFTYKDQYHHLHNHPNSIVSGVLYINTNNDNITFYKKFNSELRIEPKNFNDFNSNSHTYNVNTGDLILFPSYIDHYVSNKKFSDERISLSFNVFVKGKMGVADRLTELILV